MSSLLYNEIWKQEYLNVSNPYTEFHQEIWSHDTSTNQEYLISAYFH